MPEYSARHSLAYPVATDNVKDTALPAKLAQDLKTLALTADAAITGEGSRAEREALSGARSYAQAQDDLRQEMILRETGSQVETLRADTWARLSQLEHAAGFPNPPLTVTDEIVAGLVGGSGSETQQKADQRYTLRGELAIPASMYGAKGDGTTDDAAALRLAISSASTFGATVLLEPNRTYKINSTIATTDDDVRLASWGAPAIIQTGGQSFDAISVGATLGTISRTLTASMTIGTNGWALDDTSGIEPGMLCAVKSSLPWYYDPRPDATDTRKSELHRVVRVEGNTIWFEDPANDGYDVSAETVQMIFTRPVAVRLENLVIRGVLPAYAANTPAKSGVVLRGAYEPILQNVSVECMAYLGISLRWCYSSKVIGGHTHSANAVPTGYGVQTDGCAHTTVIGRSFYECRRGVDFSGGNIISRHNHVENCIQMGGGRQSDGQYYGWGPNNSVGIQNYGFGTHGAADHTTYRGNTSSNCQIPYSLRGRNETIDGAYHVGRTRVGMIQLITGSGFTARNIKLVAAHTGGGKGTGIYDGGANINTRRPDYFLHIKNTYDTANSRIFIEAVEAEVQDRFISMESGAVPAGFFHLGSSRATFATSSGTAEVAVLWHEGPLAAGNFRWAIGPVDYRRDGGTGTLSLTKNVNLNGIRVIEYAVSGATT